MELWVSIFALIMSAGLGGSSLLITVLGNRKAARKTEVEELRDRLKECERKCQECTQAREREGREKLDLLLEIRELKKAGDD